MINRSYLCAKCLHVITNPICPVCFLNQIEYWVREKKLPEEKKLMILNGLKKFIEKFSNGPSEIDCVLCGSRNVDLCMYCLVFNAKKILNSNTENKQILEDFTQIFNYNIWLH